MSKLLVVSKRTVQEFMDDDCPSMAAALAYYTVFSLAPLLLIVIVVAGAVFGRAAVEGRIAAQIQDLIGARAAEQAQTMIAEVSKSDAGGIAAFVGILALIFGATTAFVQLQSALNRAWEVKPDPNRGGLKDFLLKRVLSFGMILAIGFLLLVSLALSAALTAFGDIIQAYLPDGLSANLISVAGFVVSFAIVTGLFAAMYKVLPDAKVAWRDVLTGAAITALLFSIGKFALGVYLGSGSAVSPFGAAGSLALILLWTYYSSMILLFGAEFTQAWARAQGREIAPEPGAVHVVREEKPADEASPPVGAPTAEPTTDSLRPAPTGRR